MNSPASTPKKSHTNRYKVVNNTANKGGRPSTKAILEQYKDETKAFDSIRDKWTLISHKLADEALKAARDPKKDGKTLVATCTAAGIAYDKRWSKATADTTEIAMPPSLVAAIAKGCLKVDANHANHNHVSVLRQVRDMAESESSDVEPSPAPPAATDAEAEAGG